MHELWAFPELYPIFYELIYFNHKFLLYNLNIDSGFFFS